MADIVKEIQSLGGEIDSLRKKISDYDKQISNSGKSVANIERLFASYKGLDASVMSVKELAKATKELTNGYNSLTAARDGYVGKESATLELIQKLAEQNKVLAAAQREALRYGDQQGATEIYQQHVANSQAIRQYQTELDNTRGELEALEEQTNKVSKASDNFALISQAAKKANSTKDIAELVGLYKQEVTEVKGINEQIQDYSQKYKAALAAVKGGKLTPEQMDEKTMELEGYKNKLDELSNAYSVAAQRARIFANAAGENTAGIPQMEVVPMELKPKQVEFPDVDSKMKSLTASTQEASLSLDDIIKKGVKLGGLTFGVKQVMDFGRQVMAVRGEFQQLEVAFSTLLGSEQKAQKLMQQLTKTAATTPFDLQSVSKGAKQLLAYGTAAEDVNDILIHLGDIAAGLSQPLDALVYLYGTTMVQGKMMTMDLRQFQNRGIPIAEQLAKQFGVAKSEVQGLVSSGRVTAEEFHKAIMAMSSDGGKFGGLMAAQSKTISGQISNIQDSISMMFNEIGKSSEGGINAMLGGVSTLVENYETVGKVLLSLVATYGVYKAALIAVAAIEKARFATAMYNLTSDSASISTKTFLTKAIWGQVKAQLALVKAQMLSPASLITAGIVAMGVAIWGVCKALDTQERAQNKVNKANENAKKKIDSTKSDADAAISTIQSETATTYEKAAAYEKLKQIMPSLTEQYTMQQIAAMGATEAQKAEAKALEDLTFQIKENQIAAAKQRLNTLKQSRDYAMQQGQPTFGYNADIKTQEETIAKLQAELDEMKRLKEQAEFDLQPKEIKIAKFVSDKEGYEAQLEELQQQADTLLAAAKAKWEENQKNMPSFNLLSYGTNDFDVAVGQDPTAVVGANYTLLISNIKTLQGQIESTQGKINAINGATSSNVSKTVSEIIAAENTLEKARKKYASNMSEQNKKDLETAESNLKTKTDLYLKATGQQWQATKDLNKKILQEEEKLARERESILSRETSKRHQATMQYNNKLADISKEEKEWKEQNPNRELPSYFNDKKKVIYLEYTTNLKQLDEEFNDWIEGIQRETVQIQTDVEISQLERAIDLADDYNTKLEKREEINKKQIATKNAELDLEKEQTAKEKFGEKTIEKYNQLKGGKISQDALSDDEKVVFAQLERFYTEFENKRNAIIGQMEQEDANEQFNEDLQRFEEYAQGMLDAEQQYQEQLKAIRERYGLAEDVDVENSKDKRVQADVQAAQTERTRAQEIVKRDTGIQDSEIVTELAELGGKVAGKAMEEVRKIYDDFISDVNAEIQAIEKIQTTGKDAETLKSEAEMQLQTTQAQIASGTNEQGEVLSEAQKVELLKKELLLKQEIAAYDSLIESGATNGIALEERKGNLIKVRSKAEVIASNAAFNSLTKQEKQTIKQQSRIKGYTQSLSAVKEAADSIADAFGGSLSKGAKKALGAMSDIADFGMSTISSIESLTKGTMQGMEMSAYMASESISTVEKASVVLTIISMVIQAVMKIVEIASQFTKSAQLQNSIDDHLAKVDELQKRQQLIESQYATSQGSEYYRGLVKAGNEYKDIIKETQEALKEAEELYNLNLSKYGADSDKTKDAKAQWEDIKQQNQDNVNAEIEHWRSLMEEISGISLDSFAENLADALIEGFAQGKEGIDDVWEDTMDDLLRTMMRNQLAIALKDQFKDAFTSLENATKNDGVLSEDEMNAFMNNLERGKETAEQIASAYYDAMSGAGLLEDADAEGSQGFGQMTQDQADTLTARFTAVQIEMANVSATTQAMAGVVSLVGEDVKLGVAGIQSLLYNSNIALQMAQDQLDQMQIIADNTAMLAETNTRLKAIETNTGKL